MKHTRFKTSKFTQGIVRYSTGITLSVVLASAGFLTACNQAKQDEATANTPDDSGKTALEKNTADTSADPTKKVIYRPVQAISVGVNHKTNQHRFNGIVKAGKESRLSFRVAGNVTNLTSQIGDYVRKGAHIADLDSTDYHVNVTQALANARNVEASREAMYANIKQAEAELMRARSAYSRAEKLYETDTIPVSEFEQARSQWQAAEASAEARQLQYSSANAQVEAAMQQVRSAKNQLTYTKLTAPFSGVISQVLVEENEQIGAGQPVILLSNNAQTEIEVGVPASVIGSVQRGDPISANFFALPNREFTGTVTEVGFSTGNSSVYPVIIKLHNASRSVRPGMSADVTFKNGHSTSVQLILPATAIGEDKDGKYVYKLVAEKPASTDKNGQKQKALYKTVREPVVLGTMTAQGFVIQSGLTEGELVAKAGLNVMQNGDIVTLFNEEQFANVDAVTALQGSETHAGSNKVVAN